MPRGSFGGRRRHRFNYVPYQFAKAVREVIGESKHSKKVLLDKDGSRACLLFLPGAKDSAFVLPGTELCSKTARGEDEVIARGAGIEFDVLASRPYSVRVLALRCPLASCLFDEAKNSDDGIVVRSARRPFGVLGDSSSPATELLLGADPVLVSSADRDPVFFPISPNWRGKVFLDKTFHGNPGFYPAQARPHKVWVGIQGSEWNGPVFEDE
jgi:hypothetical protein